MHVAKGTVIEGKIVLNQGSFPEGAEVGVFIAQQEGTVRLSPVLQQALEEALAEADLEDGISAEELFGELRKYG